MKNYLDKNVYQAAMERLEFVFSEFDKVYVSFSAGKDSGLLLHLAIEVARRMNKLPLDILFIDMEAQYKHTIDFAERMLLRDDVRAHWICLPMLLRNAVSQYAPYWIAWDKSKKDMWVREKPNHKCVIGDNSYFDFCKDAAIDFGDCVIDFGEWFAKGEKTACLVGIRSNESLNRFRTIRDEDKETYNKIMWSTKVSPNVYNFYPIYDWRTEDIWIANGKFGYDYNKIYDLMHLAGLTLSQMRLCQPYGDDQRKGLYLFKMLEPETWSKVVSRVEGANFGNRHAGGKAIGNLKIVLPEGYTYRRYAKFLLNTMPPLTARHYRKKIWTFLRWWRKNGKGLGVTRILDSADPKLEASRQVPTWRRICKTLLKNDYWCKGLSFSQTKKESERQLDLISKYIAW